MIVTEVFEFKVLFLSLLFVSMLQNSSRLLHYCIATVYMNLDHNIQFCVYV